MNLLYVGVYIKSYFLLITKNNNIKIMTFLLNDTMNLLYNNKFKNKIIKIMLNNNFSRNAFPENFQCYKLTFRNHSSSTLCKQPIHLHTGKRRGIISDE